MNVNKFVTLTFFIVLNLLCVPAVSAHTGTVISVGTGNPPTIDGTIGDAEWGDASKYIGVGKASAIDPEGAFDVFLKHDNEHFYIAIKARLENVGFFQIDFDEGDDGYWGSGSHDGVLTKNQEDSKKVKLDNRWGLILYDGYWKGGENFWAHGAIINFPFADYDAAVSYHDNYWACEFKIPYQGDEGEMTLGVEDCSDLWISTLDTVGIQLGVGVLEVDGSYRIYSYPAPSTYLAERWLDLVFDSDNDGLTDFEENVAGTDFWSQDSDNDGLLDEEEVKTYQTNPLNVDTDNDGLKDLEEIKTHHTSPLRTDTDGDGLSDKIEVELGTNPLRTDTDGDMWGDAIDPAPTNALIPNIFLIGAVVAIVISTTFVWRKMKSKIRRKRKLQRK